jgi:hypothetical protein
VAISAGTTDSQSVTLMQIYVDGVKNYQIASNTLSTSLAMAAGGHRVTVQAYDSANRIFKSTVNITVSGSGGGSCTPGSVDPSVTICTPLNGATVNSPVQISAVTRDSQAVTLMQIYLDTVKVYEVKASSLNTSLSMAPGTHRLTVQARDAAARIIKTTINITVNGTQTGLTVSPSSATLGFGQAQQFTANASVTWDVDGIAGGNATVGTISTGGLYTAPGTAGTHTITATDSSNPPRTAHATVTVQAAPALAVSPSSATLNFGQTQQFTANKAVTWAVDGVAGGDATAGTITSAGLYTAPGTAGTHTVTATNSADPSETADAAVTVQAASAAAGVFTYKYNNARTGANLQEKTLTLTNVKSSTFGKKFSFTVDGNVYSQPLYVPNLTINGVTRNVLFVATAHDSVYAFDADGKTLTALWKKSFINSAAGVTTIPTGDVGSTIVPEIGIISTPVIDPATQTMYVVAATKESGTYKQRLHAMSLTSGAEKFAGPVVIQASVSGTGDGSVNGVIAFQPKIQLQRPALLLIGRTVYIAWASHGDNGLYHGWVMGYDSQTLARVMVHNNTPTGRRGGIWQSGGGLATDASGDIYYISGNGSWTAGKNYGDSFVRLNQDGSVADYFTPFDQSNMNAHDLDLGVGGPLVIPDQPGAHPHLITGCGKDAKIYLIDRDNMGKFQSGSNSQVVQTIPNGSLNHCHMQPVYWNSRVFFAGENSPMRMFTLSNGKFNPTPTSQTTVVFAGGDNVGTNPTVSANGSSNAIVWSIQRNASSNAVLHAFDATNLAKELYNSTQVASRDGMGTHQKYTPPLVINGRVYVSLKGKISVFGLL